MRKYNKWFLLLLTSFCLLYESGCRAPAGQANVPKPAAGASLHGGNRSVARVEGRQRAFVNADGNIVFPDAVFKNYLLAHVFYRPCNTGEISKDDAAQIFRLALPYADNLGPITNLSGIEYFTKIESLDLCGHQFKSADLSACANLKAIIIANNRDLVSLQPPQVPNVLQCVTLTNCTALKGLDLSAIPNLERLNLDGCSSCEEPLDFSKTPDVVFISLVKVPVKRIDISRGTRLRYMDLTKRPKQLAVFLSPEQDRCRRAGYYTWWYVDSKNIAWLVNGLIDG